jgi:hypothetical protein
LTQIEFLFHADNSLLQKCGFEGFLRMSLRKQREAPTRQKRMEAIDERFGTVN